MAFARERLTELFPDVRFGEEKQTPPLKLVNPALFINQLALFSTACNQEEIIRSLKAIECEAGRLPGDKELEKIVLDIDLVQYDQQILKPLAEELSRHLTFN